MIELMFEHLGEVILVRIEGQKVLFGSTAFGAVLADIEGLKLDYAGVIKEHPDLKARSDWQQEAVRRFKEKIKSFKTEEERAEYIIEDLKKHGFIPKVKQRAGFRPEVIR